MSRSRCPRRIRLGAFALVLAFAAPAAFAGETLQILKDINPGPPSSGPGNLAKMGAFVYFRASAQDGKSRLFRTDGTAAGTTVVASGPTAPEGPGWLTVVGSTLFFSATRPDTGYELWKSDGTEAGTILVRDLNPGIAHSIPQYLTAMGGTVYFSALTPVGTELWKSDGTAAGTVLVADTRPETCSSCGGQPYSGFPEALTAKHEPGGDVLYWMGQGPGDHRRLWMTAGEPGVWSAVSPETLSVVATTQAPALAQYRGDLYFVGKVTGESEWGLWRTDGEGVALVRVFSQGPEGGGFTGNQIPSNLTVFADRLYFTAGEEGFGNELWATEGTDGTTARVADIAPEAGSSDPRLLTPVGDLLFFVGNEGTSGAELWRTDGTANGTFLVADLCSDLPDSYGCGPQRVADMRHNSSAPGGLTAHEGKLYFSAYDPAYGRELFRSDGTSVELVKDFFPGVSWSDYYQREFPNSGFPGVASIERTLYVVADDGVHGLEPWTLRTLTPTEEIGGLIEEVEGLIDDGTLKLGQGKSLVGKLELALNMLGWGNTKKAITMLEAFIHEVRAFRNAGILEPEVADQMIAIAGAVIASISG